MMKHLKITLPAVFALLMMSPAAAEEAPAGADDNVRLDSAWDHADQMVGPALSPEQRSLMIQLAYDAAAANVCDGLFLNRDRVQQGFAGLVHTDAGTMTEAEKDYYERHLLINYGVQVGLMLAEFSAHPDTACNDAREAFEDPDVLHFLDLETEDE